MKYSALPAEFIEQPLPLNIDDFGDVLAPSVDKGSLVQTHRLLQFTRSSLLSCRADLGSAQEKVEADFAEARAALSIAPDRFPYGMLEAAWWQYSLAPHSYLDFGPGKCQVGLNMANRFLHLDLNKRSAQLADPEIGNELLSTTNWFDAKTGELWFASWPVRDTVRRLVNPREKCRVTIWKFDLLINRLTQMWQGEFGDSLHQVAISPDRRFLILTELGLRSEEGAEGETSVDRVSERQDRQKDETLVPSEILVLDLETGREWRLAVQTAGHVEFDPECPDICYLSEHNIGLIGVKVGIFGAGSILKIHLGKEGPELRGAYSDPRFHRITTHTVFRHREKTLIAVSGYPGRLFLIDAATMTLFKIMEKETGEVVALSRGVHLCGQDSYGIIPSRDGESIMISGTGFIQVADISGGQFVQTEDIAGYRDKSCFTGHLGTMIPEVRR